MVGKSALMGSAGSAADNRIFVYEIEGLQQNEQMDNNSYPIRSSSTIQMQVPYRSMNAEMRRITRLGGKIVSIRPLSGGASESQSAQE